MKPMLIFLARLNIAVSHSAIREEAKMQLGKLLAYENTNQECQRAITPIRETGTVIDYLKSQHNLESETQKLQMSAETMAASFKKGNEVCFTCRDKTYLKRDCPKTHTPKN